MRPKYTTIQENNKTLINDIKVVREVAMKNELETKLTKNNKELEALQMIMNKVDTYRRNTFAYLRDREQIEKMLSYIRIYKEQSD